VPSIVDESGVQASPEGQFVLNREQASRTRDLILVRLRKSRVTFRDIGLILNISEDWAIKVFHDIPVETREHYESVELV
jgi:hypothetical protein